MQFRYRCSVALLAAFCFLNAPSDSFAANSGHGNSGNHGQSGSNHGNSGHGNSGHGNSNQSGNGKPVMVNITLRPTDPTLVDLAQANGKLRYKSKKKNQQLRIEMEIPSSSTSLGITNPKTANLHVRLSRDGVDYNDCIFKYDGESDSDETAPSSAWNYAVFLKSTGKHVVAGSCGNDLTAVQAGDSVVVYVQDGKSFLGNQ